MKQIKRTVRKLKRYYRVHKINTSIIMLLMVLIACYYCFGYVMSAVIIIIGSIISYKLIVKINYLDLTNDLTLFILKPLSFIIIIVGVFILIWGSSVINYSSNIEELPIGISLVTTGLMFIVVSAFCGFRLNRRYPFRQIQITH